MFPSRREEAYYIAFLRSLLAITKTLQQDIYGLYALGYPIK